MTRAGGRPARATAVVLRRRPPHLRRARRPLQPAGADAGAWRTAPRRPRRAAACRKSPMAIVALLGIYKADAIYVPLDPASPATRLAKILDVVREPVAARRRHRRATRPGPARRRSGAAALARLARPLPCRRSACRRTSRSRTSNAPRPIRLSANLARRSRAHPVHLGIDGHAEGRRHHPRERHAHSWSGRPPTSGWTPAIASPGIRRCTSICRSSTSSAPSRPAPSCTSFRPTLNAAAEQDRRSDPRGPASRSGSRCRPC